MHAQGWLSGVFYLSTIQSNDEQGNIEFGLDGYSFEPIRPGGPSKQHSPRNGDLVLFPSSLFHRTIPFREDTIRKTIAFDVVPREK